MANSILVGYNTPLPSKTLYANTGEMLGIAMEFEGLTPLTNYFVEPMLFDTTDPEAPPVTLQPDFIDVKNDYSVNTDQLGRAIYNSRPPLNFIADYSTSVTKPEACFKTEDIPTGVYRVSAQLHSSDMEDITIAAEDVRMRTMNLEVGAFTRMELNVGSKEISKERLLSGALSVSLRFDDTSNGNLGSFPQDQVYTSLVTMQRRETNGNGPVNAATISIDTTDQGHGADYLNSVTGDPDLWLNAVYPCVFDFVAQNPPQVAKLASSSLKKATISVVDPVWVATQSTITGLTPGRNYRLYFNQLETENGDFLDTGLETAEVIYADGGELNLFMTAGAYWDAIQANASLPRGVNFQIIAQIEAIDEDAPGSGYPNEYNIVGSVKSSVILLAA